MGDTICSYNVSLKSPLLIEILNKHNAVPEEGLEDDSISLFIEEGEFNFSDFEGYVSIWTPIKNLNDFLESFIDGTDIAFPSDEMRAFLEARKEIKNRLNEIKDDLINASCFFSIEAFFPDDDTGWSIYESMSSEDKEKFREKETASMTAYEFSTRYSYNRGKEKFDYSYDFDFR